MDDFPLSWRQIGTILFFGGFAWWAFRSAARNLRAQHGDSGSRPKSTALSAMEIESVVSRGLAQPSELFNMSPSQQRFLAETAAAMGPLSARKSKADAIAEAAPPKTHCPNCGLLVENLPAQTPWRCDCIGCGVTLVLRRDAGRFILSYTPPDIF